MNTFGIIYMARDSVPTLTWVFTAFFLMDRWVLTDGSSSGG